jgi:hypothetical protein
VNGDGKITHKDLKDFLTVINTQDEKDMEPSVSAKESLEGYYDNMISRIMKELLADYKRQHIEFEEFKTFMWHTSIDKTCVIYLEHE